MAPPPIVRLALLEVLASATKPLSFSEARERACKALGRKSLDQKTVSSAFSALQKSGQAEKVLVRGKTAWTVTSKHFIDSLQNSFQELITRGVSGDIRKILDNGMIDGTVPYTIFLIPPQDEYKVADRAGMSVTASWSSPGDGIAATLFNDFLCLDDSSREGIGKMILSAYWVGIRDYIDNFLPRLQPRMTMKDRIHDLKEFVNKAIASAEARNDLLRVAGEKAVLDILGITEELIAKPNLKEFLAFVAEKRATVQDLQRKILEGFDGQYSHTGELLFSHMTMDVADRFFEGLEMIGQREVLQKLLPPHMLAARDVWNEFIGYLFGTVESRALSAMGGSLEESRKQLSQYNLYLQPLARLMSRRKVGALYLWGFPQIDAQAEKEFRFSDFDDWLAAVKKGDCDHRVWLFEDITLNRLRRAYHSVRAGREPLDQRIDKENWTLRDIYVYHPKGKDPKFWLEVLEAIESRNSEENSQHRIDAVPKGPYSEFKAKERQVILDMLDEEERRVTHRGDGQKSDLNNQSSSSC